MCSLSGQQCGSSRTEQRAEIPSQCPNQALEEGKGEARQPWVLLYQLLGLDSHGSPRPTSCDKERTKYDFRHCEHVTRSSVYYRFNLCHPCSPPREEDDCYDDDYADG
jgi:hypothetical protein